MGPTEPPFLLSRRKTGRSLISTKMVNLPLWTKAETKRLTLTFQPTLTDSVKKSKMHGMMEKTKLWYPFSSLLVLSKLSLTRRSKKRNNQTNTKKKKKKKKKFPRKKKKKKKKKKK